jgi:hypothetical protein
MRQRRADAAARPTVHPLALLLLVLLLLLALRDAAEPGAAVRP